MSELQNTLAPLGRPYTVTRSRLGAITKVYTEQYTCTLAALKELTAAIDEKIGELQSEAQPKFSFLISYSDQTHHDGPPQVLGDTIPIGKQTERVVMQWSLQHRIQDFENELSITVRVSNPLNPLLFLQAALSKSPSEMDNVQFELGSTCVTVNGAHQAYADEVFLRVKNWLNARAKPYSLTQPSKLYFRFEWFIDQLAETLFPTLMVAVISLLCAQYLDQKDQIAVIPVLLGGFFGIRSAGGELNRRMALWAQRTKTSMVFSVTNGDKDAVTKMAARANNGLVKLAISIVGNLLLNVVAGLICWWLTTRGST